MSRRLLQLVPQWEAVRLYASSAVALCPLAGAPATWAGGATALHTSRSGCSWSQDKAAAPKRHHCTARHPLPEHIRVDSVLWQCHRSYSTKSDNDPDAQGLSTEARESIWTLSNGISIARLCSAPFLGWWIVTEQWHLCLPGLVMAGASRCDLPSDKCHAYFQSHGLQSLAAGSEHAILTPS
jgi:hypothetical protein